MTARTARPTRPATPGQVEWIEKKTAEHGITYADMAQRTGHAYADLTSKTAGTWLEILFNLPPVIAPDAATVPGLYVHEDALYQLVQTQDGLRLYVKTWDAETRKWVYDRDGVKARDLKAGELVNDEDGVRNYGYVPPKAKSPRQVKQRAAQRARTVPVPFHQRYAPVPAGGHHAVNRDIEDTPAQYNAKVAAATADLDADLLAHFGIA